MLQDNEAEVIIFIKKNRLIILHWEIIPCILLLELLVLVQIYTIAILEYIYIISGLMLSYNGITFVKKV